MSDRRLSMLATGSTDTIRNIRRGVNPRADTLEAICRVLGVQLQIGAPGEEGAAPIGQPLKTLTAADSATSPVEPTSSAEGATSPPPSGEELRDQMATILRAEAQTIRQEVCEGISQHLHSLQDETISRLTRHARSLEDTDALVYLGDGFGESQETRHVEIVQYSAAAGGGAEAFEERVVGTLAFCRQWMDRYGLRPLDCVVIDVHGESMEPTLWDGATILLDRSRAEWRPGDIFVVRATDGVVVKRAGEDEAGNRQLLSDHPAWESVPYPDDADILGQVVWTARTLIAQ